MKSAIMVDDLPSNTLSLAAFIEAVKDCGCDLSAVNIETRDGQIFQSAALIEEILSDGSRVFNLMLL